MEEELVDIDKLQERLLKKNGCGIQGPGNGGWPCNSCFHAMEIPGLEHDIHEYWLAVLGIRGDYEWVEPNHDLIEELYHALGA